MVIRLFEGGLKVKLTRTEIGWMQQLLYREAIKMRRLAREKGHIFITKTIANIQADNYELLLTKFADLIGDGDTQEFKVTRCKNAREGKTGETYRN